MSAKDLESYEWSSSRMEKNAKKVCGEVSSRVDGAPTIDGFMKSYVKDQGDLKVFSRKEEKRKDMPGYNFYEFFKTFAVQHARKAQFNESFPSVYHDHSLLPR